MSTPGFPLLGDRGAKGRRTCPRALEAMRGSTRACSVKGKAKRTMPKIEKRCGPVDRLIEAGAGAYRRDLVLPRLIAVGPDDLRGAQAVVGRRICALLARALRAERNRGRAGHWTYDLNRHIGLAQALKAERAALAGCRLQRPVSVEIAPGLL